MSSVLTYLITYFIEGVIAFFYFNTISAKKKNITQTVLCTTAAYAILFGLSFFHSISLNGLAFVACNFLLAMTAFAMEPGKAAFNSVSMTILMASAELITMNIIGAIFPAFDIKDMEYHTFVLYLVMCKLLYLAALLVLMRTVRTYGTNDASYTCENILLGIIPVMSYIILTILISICLENDFTQTQELLIASCSFCIIVINILVFYVQDYSVSKHHELMELQNERQTESDESHYNNMISEHISEQRILIHDIKNHLSTISLMARLGKDAEMEEYISNLCAAPALNAGFVQTGNPHLSMLLSRYMSICRSKKISLTIDFQNAGLDFLEQSELTTLFCNLMDIAVGLSENTPDSFIRLKISEKGGSNTIISVDCSYSSTPDSRGPHKTPDGVHHRSIAMKGIHRIVDKHSGNMMTGTDEALQQYHVIINMFH